MTQKARYINTNDAPMEPQSFSMGVHLKRRMRKKPGKKPHTTKRIIAKASWSASIYDQCNGRVRIPTTSHTRKRANK